MTTNEIMRMAMACVSAAIRENNSDKPDSSSSGVANLGLYQAIDALVSERDALRTDAERYRWIRTAGAWESELTLDALRDDPEEFDAAVDASKEGKT